MEKNCTKTPKSRKKTNFFPAFMIFGMIIFVFISLNSFQDPAAMQQEQEMEAPATETYDAETETDIAVDLQETEESTETAVADMMVSDVTFVRGEYTSRQTRRGERLFFGVAAYNSGTHDCASCHYTQPPNEINWNPAAYEVAKLWRDNPDYSIMDIMNNPMSTRLMEDHAGMTITEEEQHLLEAYFVQLLEKGPGELKTPPVRAAIFWGLGFLMLLALVDLIFTRKVSFKGFHIFILFIGIAVHGQFAMAEAIRLGRTQDFAPDQPIKFSHLIHSGENEIDCQYCHFTANYSMSANIPSNNVCLNCHNVILSGTYSGAFEINKIHRAADTGEPIEWVRIHNLPDHSFFSHAQHVNAGKQECSDCHGAVETMHIVRQVEDLSMGWCLTCHRETNVDFTDNPYFQMYERLHEKIRTGEIDGVTAADLGGEDCMSCHY